MPESAMKEGERSTDAGGWGFQEERGMGKEVSVEEKDEWVSASGGVASLGKGG